MTNFKYTQPRILYSKPTHHFIEDDCACPLPSSTRYDCVVAVDKPLQIFPNLHRAYLPESHELAFNPLGMASVVVLNQPVVRILNTFNTPITLKEASTKVNNSDSDHVISTVNELVALGLLTTTDNIPTLSTRTQTLTAWLHVTNACNLRCDYCYVHKTPDKMEIEHGMQAVEAVFRSARANGFQQVKLKYAGGEATLNLSLVLVIHKHASELAKHYKIGLDGVVLSNGVFLSDRAIQALQENGIRLSISLDGVGKYHDMQRHYLNRRGSFTQIEQTLERLHIYNFKPSITITVSNRNLKGLAEVVKYVLDQELPFTINFFRENECSTSFTDLAYHDEQIIAAMRAAFAIIEANLPPFSLLGALLDRARLDAPHNRVCGVGQSYMVIDQNGKVAKCHMEMEQTITDVSADDPLKLIKLAQIGIQNLSVEEKAGCQECYWRYWCAGGCPALTYRATGRWDVKSPNCKIYRTLFPEVLRLEGLRLLKYTN